MTLTVAAVAHTTLVAVALRLGTTMSSTADAITTSRAADAFVAWRATIAVAFGAIAMIAVLTWIGGELHYRNCLAKAELQNPNGFAYAAPNPKSPGAVGYLTPTRLDQGTKAADRCTRIPW